MPKATSRLRQGSILRRESTRTSKLRTANSSVSSTAATKSEILSIENSSSSLNPPDLIGIKSSNLIHRTSSVETFVIPDKDDTHKKRIARQSVSRGKYNMRKSTSTAITTSTTNTTSTTTTITTTTNSNATAITTPSSLKTSLKSSHIQVHSSSTEISTSSSPMTSSSDSLSEYHPSPTKVRSVNRGSNRSRTTNKSSSPHFVKSFPPTSIEIPPTTLIEIQQGLKSTLNLVTQGLIRTAFDILSQVMDAVVANIEHLGLSLDDDKDCHFDRISFWAGLNDTWLFVIQCSSDYQEGQTGENEMDLADWDALRDSVIAWGDILELYG